MNKEHHEELPVECLALLLRMLVEAEEYFALAPACAAVWALVRAPCLPFLSLSSSSHPCHPSLIWVLVRAPSAIILLSVPLLPP